jgi:hypothetical protein
MMRRSEDYPVKKSTLAWIVSVVVTVAGAYYQRVTGPTHPLSGAVTLEGRLVDYRLPRSHAGPSDAAIRVRTDSATITGEVEYKRYKLNEGWTCLPMRRVDGALVAELPHQPMAGKLEYRVRLAQAGESRMLPPGGPAIIRFRGDVPAAVLILHIIAMFGAMLLSTRTGLEYFHETGRLRFLTFWTIGFLVAGGAILGPIVQKYAFGAYWMGWPYGTDLTDNKTAIALAGWLVAAFSLYRSERPRLWAAIAALLLLIPHSLLGSELDYRTLEQTTSQ